MKNIKLILIVFTALYFASCKKDYTCVCSNPNGKSVAFTKKTTKKKATNDCVDYYNTNFGSVAFNDTSCEIE